MYVSCLSLPDPSATAGHSTSDDSAGVGRVVWNVPNQLSAARIVLAIACFVLLSIHSYIAALVVFLLAAVTDWADGYWARKYNQITQLGRILDPFADKLVICGTFIFLAAAPGSRIAPWMAVMVMAREMLVTALRSFVEQGGGDFSAKWAGKWKMVFQCAAVSLSLIVLSQMGEEQAEPGRMLVLVLDVVVWAAIALTIYSGWGYLRTVWRTLSA